MATNGMKVQCSVMEGGYLGHNATYPTHSAVSMSAAQESPCLSANGNELLNFTTRTRFYQIINYWLGFNSFQVNSFNPIYPVYNSVSPDYYLSQMYNFYRTETANVSLPNNSVDPNFGLPLAPYSYVGSCSVTTNEIPTVSDGIYNNFDDAPFTGGTASYDPAFSYNSIYTGRGFIAGEIPWAMFFPAEYINRGSPFDLHSIGFTETEFYATNSIFYVTQSFTLTHSDPMDLNDYYRKSVSSSNAFNFPLTFTTSYTYPASSSGLTSWTSWYDQWVTNLHGQGGLWGSGNGSSLSILSASYYSGSSGATHYDANAFLDITGIGGALAACGWHLPTLVATNEINQPLSRGAGWINVFKSEGEITASTHAPLEPLFHFVAKATWGFSGLANSISGYNGLSGSYWCYSLELVPHNFVNYYSQSVFAESGFTNYNIIAGIDRASGGGIDVPFPPDIPFPITTQGNNGVIGCVTFCVLGQDSTSWAASQNLLFGDIWYNPATGKFAPQ